MEHELNEALDIAARVAALGAGATLVLDGWSLVLQKAAGVPFPDYPMIGRWVGHFGRLRFRHRSMACAAPILGESLIGWTTHYVIGVGYAALLVVVAGRSWLSAPTLGPALILGLATIAAPFFVMQPAMGAGFAASKTPRPALVRARSLAAHLAFGIGLYVSALVLAMV